MNEELKQLYEADRQEHAHVPPNNTPEYKALRERDRQRRQRAAELIAAGQLGTVEDYYHAARLFQHGDTPEDAWKAHTLALKSAQLGYRPAPLAYRCGLRPLVDVSG
jgi:hypothetical protein